MGGHGRLFTSVADIDGADSITAVLPDGKRQPIAALIAINRMQDWAILAGGTEQTVDQPLASDASVQIGDRVFSLDASAYASRVLVDGQVSGRAGSPATGPRFIMTAGRGSPPAKPRLHQFA